MIKVLRNQETKLFFSDFTVVEPEPLTKWIFKLRILLLGIHPKKRITNINKEQCTKLFIPALYIVAKDWKLLYCITKRKSLRTWFPNFDHSQFFYTHHQVVLLLIWHFKSTSFLLSLILSNNIHNITGICSS